MPVGGVPAGDEGLEPGGRINDEEIVEGVGIEGGVTVTLGGWETMVDGVLDEDSILVIGVVGGTMIIDGSEEDNVLRVGKVGGSWMDGGVTVLTDVVTGGGTIGGIEVVDEITRLVVFEKLSVMVVKIVVGVLERGGGTIGGV